MVIENNVQRMQTEPILGESFLGFFFPDYKKVEGKALKHLVFLLFHILFVRYMKNMHGNRFDCDPDLRLKYEKH